MQTIRDSLIESDFVEECQNFKFGGKQDKNHSKVVKFSELVKVEP